MKSYFLKLCQYNSWANQRVLSCLVAQPITDEKILTLFSHLLSAQFIWMHRLKGLPPAPYELWKKYDSEKLKVMTEESSKAWLDYISENENFDRILKYHNYTGDYFENNVQHIIIHVMNHGTYHRGQIALLLRQNGFEPVNTDFITFDRIISGQLQN